MCLKLSAYYIVARDAYWQVVVDGTHVSRDISVTV